MPEGTARSSSTPTTSWPDPPRRWPPRSEWRRTARWHAEVSASSDFEQRERTYVHTVETSPELALFAAHHRPFYEQLHARRLDVSAGETPHAR